MLFVFGNQQVNSLLWNADFSDRCFRLRTGQGQFSVWIFHILLADGDGFILGVEVAPEKRRDLSLAQSRDQLQIEHGEQPPLVRGVEVGLDMLWRQNLHFDFLHLRCDAVLGGVAKDQAFFYGAVQGIVEHQVQTADGGAAEPGAAVTAFAVGTATLHQLLVELLQIVGGQLGELDIADTRNGVLLDHQVIAIRRGDADIWLGIDVVPAPQPRGHGVFVGAADVDALCGLHSSGQLCLALRLRLAENVFDDALYCFHQRASSFLLSRPEVYGILFQRGVSQS